MRNSYLNQCFYFFTILYFVEANHFLGGTISWQSVESNNTNFNQSEIRIIQTYSWIGSLSSCTSLNSATSYLKCVSNCSNYILQSYMKNKCINYDMYVNVTTTRSIESTVNALNTKIVLAYQSSAWAKVSSVSKNWSLATFINLIKPNDTKRINSSPITSMSPIITLPTNSTHIIRIPMIDTDGDIVKCRWATKNSTYYSSKIDECSGVCHNHPYAQLYTTSNLDNNCTLVVDIKNINYYAIAIQIEDFTPSAPNNLLSSIPLQFVIRGINDPCYLPNIVGELSNGVTVTVSANTPFSTSVIAKTGCYQTKITKFSTDILPFGITSTSSIIRLNSITYSIIFTWTPSTDQIGTKQLYCTIAIDDDNRQSTQYCLNFIVVEKNDSPSESKSESNDIGVLLGLSLGLGLPLFLLIIFTTGYYIYFKYSTRKIHRTQVSDIELSNTARARTENLRSIHEQSNTTFPRPISACSNEFQSNSMTMTRTTFVSSAPNDYEKTFNSFSQKDSPLNGNSELVKAYFRQVLEKKR